MIQKMQGNESFEKSQYWKRTRFSEKCHAAFILSTSFCWYGVIPEDKKQWLVSVYPNSKITQEEGFTTIEPLF